MDKIKNLLVTGGAGFIGSAFVRNAIQKGYAVTVVDKLSYAGDVVRLGVVSGNYKFYKINICNIKQLGGIIAKEKPDVIVNFAAETHVDRSILDAHSFVETNIRGVQVLLDLCRNYSIPKFIHISTDEVYGEIREGKFSEKNPLLPNSPYAASKGAADLLVKAYMRTYRIPAIILRPCNNYGPWQYPEKFIPVIILKALLNEKIPVYADGKNKREWLFVDDCAAGILMAMTKGKIGETYNIGSGIEKENIDVVKMILRIMKKPSDLIHFVEDRPGHDYRYALDFSKIKRLGWKPQVDFTTGIDKTLRWYLNNQNWLQHKMKDLKKYWRAAYK